MTHRMKTLLMACMIAAVGQAQTVATADTLARDLSELEAIMPDSAITDNPTGDYGAPKPNDIDAMRFLTDRQHWYRGDPLRQGGGRWFLQVDGGFAAYASSPAVGLTPRQEVMLRAGHHFSPVHALRLGVGGALGFIDRQENPSAHILTGKADADYLFSLSNYLLGYRPERPLDVSALIGLTAQYSTISQNANAGTAAKNAFAAGLRLGTQLKFFAGSRTSIALEPYFVIASPSYALYKKGASERDYATGYGVAMQVVHHLGQRLTPSSTAGQLKRQYRKGQRLFADDSTARFWRRPSFIDLQGGIVGHARPTADFGGSIGPIFSLSFGHWLSSAVALRITGEAGHFSPSQTDGERGKLRLLSAGLDALVNPFGFRRDYNWQSPVGLNLIAGLHAARTSEDGQNRAAIGPKAGLQLWGRITNHLHLTLEPSYSWAEQFGNSTERRLLEGLALKAGAQIIIDRELPSTLAKDYRATRDGLFSVGRAVGLGVASAAVFVGKNVGRGASAVYHGAVNAGRWVGSLDHSKSRHPLFVEYSYGYGGFPGAQAKFFESCGSTTQASLGWWPMSWLGLRASAMVAKGSTIVQRASDGNSDHDDRKTTEYAAGSFDLLFNPLGMSRHFSWDAPAGFNLIASYQNGFYTIGGVNTFAKGKNKYFGGLRLGAQFWVRLSDDLRFHCEPLYSMLNVANLYVNDNNPDLVSITPRKGYSLSSERQHVAVRFGLTLFLRRQKHRENHEGETAIADRRWFAGVTSGWNFYCRKHYLAGTGRCLNGTIIAGYNLNKIAALRLSTEFLDDDVLVKSGDYTMRNFRLALSSLSWQANITNIFSGYQPARRFEGVVHAGPALSTDMQRSSRQYWGLTGGVTLNWHINKWLALTATHSHYLFGLWDHGMVFRTGEIVHKVTIISTFNMGVMFKF